MEDFLAILSLLIITGLFTGGFALSVFVLRSPSSDLDKEKRMVVAGIIESLRKYFPVGVRKGWTLIPTDFGISRSWKKPYHFPVLKTNITLHASSVIVKSISSVVKDLISKPVYWDEWDSCYFSSSMNLCENDCPELRCDKYMKCILVSNDKMYSNNALMYCFMNSSSDHVRWILFWNITCVDWWFFLIQPAMRKSDAAHCLLTLIRGTDSGFPEQELAKSVVFRIRNIKETAELRSLIVFQFNPVFDSFTPCEDLIESSTEHNNSCMKKNHTESCCKDFFKEEKTLCQNKSDVLLQLVSSSKGNTSTSGRSRKFNICLVDVQPTRNAQDNENSERSSRHETRPYKRKERSLSLVSTTTASSTCGSEQRLQETSGDPRIMSVKNSGKNKGIIFHEKSPSVSVKQADNSASRYQDNNPNFECKNTDMQNQLPKQKDSEPELGIKRKQSFVELRRKFSGISPVDSNANSSAHVSNNLLESESHVGVIYGKSDIRASQSSTTTTRTVKKNSFAEEDTRVLDSNERSGQHSDCTMNSASCGSAIVNLNNSSVSNDKTSTCEGNCSPICEVCLEAAYQETSDFEIILPNLDISEQRITDLLTKGNYCAAELQAQVHEASQVKTSNNLERKHSVGRWMLVSSNKDIDLFLKTKDEGLMKILSYLCQTKLPVSASSAWDLIRNPRVRFICDETAKKVTVLKELPEQQKIIYTYHEFGGLLKKESMDFCLLHSERIEHSKYSLAYVSIEYENCPLSCALRGMLFPSGWVIEKLKGNSEECAISHLIQVVVNRPDSLLVQESSNIVLHSIQNLKNYIISVPGNVS